MLNVIKLTKRERIIDGPMLNKVLTRDFCEEVIFEIQRTRKSPFEK